MKISFNTTKASQTELLLVRDIINKYIHPSLKDKYNDTIGESTVTPIVINVGTPAPDSFNDREQVGEFTATLTGDTGVKQSDEYEPVSAADHVKIYSTLDEVKKDFGEPTSDEFEPDDEDESPASTTLSIDPIEGMSNTFVATFTNTGNHKVTVIEPGETATVSVPVVPPPPVTSLHTMMVADASSPPMEVVVPPPPPATVTPPPSTNQSESVPQGSSSYVDPYDSQSGDLDSDGTPWDATIHSESRAKNADGTWRKRRVNKNVEVKAAIAGLEKITPNSVPAPPRAEYTPLNAMGEPFIDTRKMVRTFVRIDGAQDLIAAPEGATDAELSLITGKPTIREVVAPPTAQVPPPPPAAPPVIKTAAPGAPAGTWPELMERVTKYFGAQKITSVDLAEICKTFNIGSVQECFTQPHLIPLISSAIDEKAGV